MIEAIQNRIKEKKERIDELLGPHPEDCLAEALEKRELRLHPEKVKEKEREAAEEAQHNWGLFLRAMTKHNVN